MSAAGTEPGNETHVIEPSPDSGAQDSGAQDSGAQDSGAQGSSRVSRYFKVVKDKIKKTLSPDEETTILGLITNNKTTLTNLVISLAVLGLQFLLNAEVFDCPLENHQIYGRFWLYGPATIIFFLNMLLIGDVWELSDRCLVADYYHFGFFCGRTFPSIVKALVGASVWLCVAFLQKDYYICGEVGPDIRKRNVTDPEELKKYDLAVETAGAQSQIFAWVVFLVMAFFATVVIINKNCILKDQDILDDICTFEEREAKWAIKTFTEFTRGLRCEEDPSEDHDKQGNSTADNKSKRKGDDQLGKEKEEEVKITLYPDGIPEKGAEKMVTEMFKGWKDEKPNWHYRDAYDDFVKLYPRAASGNPGKRWSTTHLSVQFAKKAGSGNNRNNKLPIHRSDSGSTRFEMQNLTVQSDKADVSKEEHQETTSLIAAN